MTALDAALKQQIDRLAVAGSADLVFPQLSAFARLVASSSVLARALTEADSSKDAKRALLADLLGSQLSDEALHVAVELVSASVSSQKLPKELANASAQVAFVAAEQAGELEALEASLYQFSVAVKTHSELRSVLTDPSVNDKAKADFVVDLLSERLDGRAIGLIHTIISLDHGRDSDISALALSEAAAERRHVSIAEITSAVELDSDRKDQLVAALARSTGKAINGRFVVDPSIVGSIVVRIGDEVLDGSVRHQFMQAKAALSAS